MHAQHDPTCAPSWQQCVRHRCHRQVGRQAQPSGAASGRPVQQLRARRPCASPPARPHADIGPHAVPPASGWSPSHLPAVRARDGVGHVAIQRYAAVLQPHQKRAAPPAQRFHPLGRELVHRHLCPVRLKLARRRWRRHPQAASRNLDRTRGDAAYGCPPFQRGRCQRLQISPGPVSFDVPGAPSMSGRLHRPGTEPGAGPQRGAAVRQHSQSPHECNVCEATRLCFDVSNNPGRAAACADASLCAERNNKGFSHTLSACRLCHAAMREKPGTSKKLVVVVWSFELAVFAEAQSQPSSPSQLLTTYAIASLCAA